MPWMDGWTMDSQSSSYSIWISTRWTDKQRLLCVQRCQIKRPRITITLSASPVCTPSVSSPIQILLTEDPVFYYTVQPAFYLQYTLLWNSIHACVPFNFVFCHGTSGKLLMCTSSIAAVGPLNRTIPRKLTEGEVYSATQNILNSFFNSSRLLFSFINNELSIFVYILSATFSVPIRHRKTLLT